MFITKKHLSRRTVLKGMGVSLSLPMFEAMLPAMTPMSQTAAGSKVVRLACLENVHGVAGSAAEGIEKNYWAPAATGDKFDLTPTSLLPLQPYRDYVTIVSNTDSRGAEAIEINEIGGDHFRSAAVFLTQVHPKQTEGSDVFCGTSLDQLYAQHIAEDSPVPSIQLSIESVDQAGGCSYGYSCVYTDSISWASPTKPLPQVRDPRVVFDQLFGAGGSPQARSARRKTTVSILDWITRDVARLQKDLGPTDRSRLDEYLEDVREIERRIQGIEQRNLSGEQRELPNAPVGVPDSFEEHVKLMFDLQAVAFAGDITRVSSFKLSRDVSGRVYPESGVRTGFHNASHHGSKGPKLADFALLNKYHVSMIPYFLEKLKNTPDGDGTLLDNTLMIYGCAMGDGNLHNHKRCPLFLAGHAGGALKGNLHFKAPDGAPMANAWLTVLHKLGMDTGTFGDSTGEIEI
jgi:Protein of unknown function (DUF1552)